MEVGDVLYHPENGVYVVARYAVGELLPITFVKPVYQLVRIGIENETRFPIACNVYYRKDASTSDWVTEEGIRASGFEYTGINISSVLKNVAKEVQRWHLRTKGGR